MRSLAFRLIPREEKFFNDFQALADELHARRPAARGDAGARSADLGQGRRDQGSRAQVRLPDPRDHPAAEPDVRHAARPRGHPRARPVARRRDGRDRRVGGASSASTGSRRSASARASWRSIITASTEQVRLALDALEQHKGAHRRTPSRSTASRTKPTACTRGGQPAVRRRDATRSS